MGMFTLGVERSGSPALAYYDIANDIGSRKGTYKLIPRVRPRNEAQVRAVVLTRAFGHLGLAAEESSAVHVVRALSYIDSIADDTVKRLRSRYFPRWSMLTSADRP